MSILNDYYFYGEMGRYSLPPSYPLPVTEYWRSTIFCEPLHTQPSMSHPVYNNLPPIPPMYYLPWYMKDSLYKRSSPVDPRESPGRDFPSKLFKHDRLSDQPDHISSTQHIDTQHIQNLNKKTTTAGTQTQFSSFHSVNKVNYSYYPNPPPHPHLPPPPPLVPQLEEQNTPLNLSITNPDTKTIGTQQQQHHQQFRPSVITCITNHPSPNLNTTSNINRPIREPSPVQVAVTDSDIEEHFRRSLGKSYSPPQPEVVEDISEDTSETVDPNVSITGTVDDHFAKSLGDTTWTAIKAKNDLVALDLFTGSVDDHFAKALGGDTWLRIKAEKETSCSGNSSPSNSPPQVSLVTN